MPGRVSGPDLSPKMLLQNSAAPRGPLPAPKNAEGSVETPRRASQGLLEQHLSADQCRTSGGCWGAGRPDWLTDPSARETNDRWRFCAGGFSLYLALEIQIW